MALPTTGQLSMSQVRTELGGSGAQSLSAAGVTLASITAGNQVRLFGDLAGTSAATDITLSWGSSSTYLGDPIRAVSRANHVSPQIITVNFNWYIGYIDSTWRIYSGFSTSPTTTEVAGLAGSSLSGSFNVTGIAYNSSVWIRWSTGTFNAFGISISFNGGSVTSGTPVVSVTGTSTWFP
jgi:hypothetical protein